MEITPPILPPSEEEELLESVESEAAEAPSAVADQAVPEAEADQQVQQQMANHISAGHDIFVQESLVLNGTVAGNDISLVESAAIAAVAGGNTSMKESGVVVAVVGGDTHLDESAIGLLVSGGEVHLGEGSRILMTTQQALVFGLAAGAALGLFNLLFGKKRKK